MKKSRSLEYFKGNLFAPNFSFFQQCSHRGSVYNSEILCINSYMVMCVLGEAIQCYQCTYNELRAGDDVIYREGDGDCVNDPTNVYAEECYGICQVYV